MRVTTESLLAEMTGLREVGELFEWLRSLSFMDTRPGGLFPTTWRASADRRPEVAQPGLVRRAAPAGARPITSAASSKASGAEQQLALFDLVFLHRENPVVRPVFEWAASGRVLPGPLQEQICPACSRWCASMRALHRLGTLNTG